MIRILPLILFAAAPALADDLPLPIACSGLNPDWGLEITQGTSTLAHRDFDEMQLSWETQAEGADWPRALTLIGRGTSAIVILDRAECEGGDMTGLVLTQQGETPLLLSGCCQSSQ